jgi:cation diffusion facilitator family transporter
MTATTTTPAEESALKRRVALVSIGASVLLTLAKAAGAILSGSLALLSEALHGLIDIFATVVTYFAVRAADQPADDEHHYGHGKVEALAALAETALLFGLAGAVTWEAYGRLRGDAAVPIEVTPLVIGMLLFAIAIDITRWRTLTIVARDTRSEALAADALHFSADAVSSSLALCGLIAVKLGFPQGDAIAALGVAGFISVAGFRLARRTVNTLVDAAPTGMSERVRAIAAQTPAVVGTQWVRLRPSGGRVIGEVGIHVSRSLPLDQVTDIKRALQERIRADIPELDATVTADPIALDDETALERVLIAAARLRIPVHHVTIQHVGEMQQLSVSLDVEVDSTLSMDAAHAKASELEAAIRTEFGAGTEVETHIEPLETGLPAGQPASWEVVQAIGEILAAEAQRGGVVSDVHSVRVRQTEFGLTVNCHARVDGGLDVAAAHRAVDRMERALREKRPDIFRVVTHAEPRRRPEAAGTSAISSHAR